MQHLALDLDGTISAAPELFAAMGAAMVKDGHTVTVLTGALLDFPDSARTTEGRLAQLKALGLERGIHFSDVFVCVAASGGEVARAKRAWCLTYGVDLLIDDEPLYCQAVNELSSTRVAQFARKAS